MLATVEEGMREGKGSPTCTSFLLSSGSSIPLVQAP